MMQISFFSATDLTDLKKKIATHFFTRHFIFPVFSDDQI